ncbi:RagB/SusD family nutrient uptake outer membrane protein [Sphingobacterium psychroaquaticum]|uniref:SusD family protein n=1 Tax=Sphingobacterium psychroaquaticum TaxID=561061 RepID=A0A1X7IK98_9SPHI|nr:RagB/SusD family nutrient uptake outer membrane protein [Sphingobacterium psychroaquaticum]QBQ41479.1 RagB/SusD family nutrient uptake outer membrane protein [Sphingobacterium psychroaquaticum]SMG14745.1 SusD family protein [Sphingobacterium psychroaquaticum]
MKKYFNIFLASAVLATSFSCKGFLDVEPTNATDADKAVKTANDAQIVINGIQRQMTSSSYYGRNFICYGDVKGGDVTLFSQGRGLDQFYTFNHNPQANSFSSFWTGIYGVIYQANSLLENIEKLKAEGTTENFDLAKSEALTIRALSYFDLVRIYGKSYTDDKNAYGVPNVIQTLAYNEKPLRATVDENYKQILTDLVAAEAGLPKTKREGYLNYYTNKAIQARVYLTMGDFDKALAAAEEIINSKVYTLYENDQWVNSWKSQFGSESIYELVIEQNQADLARASLGFYFMRRSHQTGALGNFLAATPFLNALNQDAADVRKGVMLRDESSTQRMGSCYKYLGSTTFSGDKGSSNYTAVNIKVIRLSEIYLIAAEAALKASTPNPTKAATYAQAIHKRSPNLPAITAANVTEALILAEKSKEFYGEGLRYFDMLRLNKTITFDDAFAGISVPTRETSINRSFSRTILPISQDEINANPAIKAQQNPGY